MVLKSTQGGFSTDGYTVVLIDNPSETGTAIFKFKVKQFFISTGCNNCWSKWRNKKSKIKYWDKNNEIGSKIKILK